MDISHKMDELIAIKDQVGWNSTFNLYLHTCMYMIIVAILSSQ